VDDFVVHGSEPHDVAQARRRHASSIRDAQTADATPKLPTLVDRESTGSVSALGCPGEPQTIQRQVPLGATLATGQFSTIRT